MPSQMQSVTPELYFGGAGGGYYKPSSTLGYDPTEARLTREGYATQRGVANINQTGARLQQQRFNTVFPWLKNQVTGLLGQYSNTVGGQSGQGPAINAGPVYNPQQIQQQINAARAYNDQSAASQARVAARQFGGAGGAPSSPLLRAMQNQYGMQARAQNATAGREIPWNAAQANAQQQLAGQTAREQQFSNRMNEDIERRRTILGMFPSLLSSISGLV